MRKTQIQLFNFISKSINTFDTINLFMFYLIRQFGILQEFHGRESDKIWLEVKSYLDRVLKEPIKQQATA